MLLQHQQHAFKSAFSLCYVQMSAVSFDAHTKTGELPAFHKVQWLHFTEEMDTFIISCSYVTFLWDFVY